MRPLPPFFRSTAPRCGAHPSSWPPRRTCGGPRGQARPSCRPGRRSHRRDPPRSQELRQWRPQTAVAESRPRTMYCLPRRRSRCFRFEKISQRWGRSFLGPCHSPDRWSCPDIQIGRPDCCHPQTQHIRHLQLNCFFGEVTLCATNRATEKQDGTMIALSHHLNYVDMQLFNANNSSIECNCFNTQTHLQPHGSSHQSWEQRKGKLLPPYLTPRALIGSCR